MTSRKKRVSLCCNCNEISSLTYGLVNGLNWGVAGEGAKCYRFYLRDVLRMIWMQLLANKKLITVSKKSRSFETPGGAGICIEGGDD